MIKKLLILLLLISYSMFSQNFDKVDNTVLKYPQFFKVEDLASQIEKDFTSDIDKARAAFFLVGKKYSLRFKRIL